MKTQLSLKTNWFTFLPIAFSIVMFFFTTCEEEEKEYPPTVTIASPNANDEFFESEEFTIRATASDENNDIFSMNLFINGVRVCDTISASLEYTIQPSMIEEEFYKEGEWEIEIIAQDQNGNIGSSKMSITIKSSTPIASFIANKTVVNVGENVQFTDQSTLEPTSWHWHFIDGNTSTEQNPTHSYSSGGKFPVRLIASNEYGADTAFLTITCVGDGVIDADGNTYETVTIGNQTWLTENLKTTTLTDGTALENYFSEGNNPERMYYAYYLNEIEYLDSMGAVYTIAVIRTEKICPCGWHVASKNEWEELFDYAELNSENGLYSLISEDWGDDGTDEYGFNIVHSPSYGSQSIFEWFYTIHLTSTITENFCCNYGFKFTGGEYLNVQTYDISWLASIRCIKD